MEGVLALLIPLIPVTVFGVWLLGKTEIGRAVARRIEGKASADREQLTWVQEELDALHDEIERLQRDQSETHERLEFTERLLARKPEDRGG
jgi:predicted thioredoxin/glutaredoxin